MRVLVIGFPLPNPQIDNYSFISAPSFFDYDAVVVESAAVSAVVEEVLARTADHHTAAGQPVLNEPSGPFVTGLADHLRRRRDEAERLLAAGKLLVVLLRPNVPHPHVLGEPGYDRYSWLPAPPGVSYRPPQIMPADGRVVAPVEHTHALTRLVDRFKSWFTYRAYISDRSPAFPEHGKVLMRSDGGAAIAAEFRIGPGRLVLLPALEDVPQGEPRFELAAHIVQAVKRARHGDSETDAPRWTSGFTLPGLEEREQEERDARAALDAAQQRLSRAQEQTAELAGMRRLLWTEGKADFEPAVRNALRTLRFMLDDDVDKPGTLYADGRTAFFEVDAAEEQVNEDVYVRLQRRQEADLIETGEPKKGIVFINGHRRTSPERRDDQMTRALRVACEHAGYAIVTGPQLFELSQRALASELLNEHRRLRDLILDSTGLLVLPPPEDGSAEPATPEPA